MSIKRRVNKTHSLLSSRQTLLIDTVEDRRKDWRRSGSTTDELRSAVEEDDDIVTDGADVGVAAAGDVVETALGDALGWVVHVGGVVGLVGWSVLCEVGVDVGVLVAWAFV